MSALINSQGFYNYNNMSLIKRLLKDGGIFFDVGANIGSYSLIASEQEKALVYSFEPHPVTFEMLQENININQRQNVKLFNMALGTVNGKISFSDDPGSTTNCIVQGEGQNNIQVDCFRGDLFCKMHQVSPFLMKIDVEGFEYDVLSGFGELLPEIDLLFIEINGLSNLRSKGEREIVDLLIKNEFRGPLFFNNDFLTFSSRINGEDSIFANPRFLKNTELIIDANLTKQ
ncbi:MAG: FkbM family methyltransferase [Nitrospiria bacterium]